MGAAIYEEAEGAGVVMLFVGVFASARTVVCRGPFASARTVVFRHK